MRALIQKVAQASVIIESVEYSQINHGLMVLLGIEDADDLTDIQWLVSKIGQMRLFNDENGVMNLSVKEVSGDVMVVSQFTLHASTKKGNRPSYIAAAKPEISIPLYEAMIQQLEKDLDASIQTGKFGADMKVALINDGPVTFWLHVPPTHLG